MMILRTVSTLEASKDDEHEEVITTKLTRDCKLTEADKSLWATEEIDRISALSHVLVSVSESILRDTLSCLRVFRKLQVLLNKFSSNL